MKQLRDARHAAYMARHYPPKPPPPPPRCLCGLTAQEVDALWVHHLGREVRFYCRVCAPAEVRAELGI